MLPRAIPFLERVGDDDILTLDVEGQVFHFALVPGSRARLGRECHWQKPHQNGNIVQLKQHDE